MKVPLISICVVALVGVVIATIAIAGNTVTCTVTPGNYSVSVGSSTADYGSMLIAETKTSAKITATNDGSLTEKINIAASNAVYGTTQCGGNPCTWTLSTTAPGTDTIVHAYSTKATAPATGATLGSDPTTEWVSMDTTSNYKVLVASKASSGTQDFYLDMRTPSAAGSNTSYGHEYSSTVTLQAVAP